MSNTFLPLFKTNLKISFDFRTKKQKASALTMLILVTIFGLAFSALYSFIFVMSAIETNASISSVVYMMAGFASLLATTTTIPKVRSTLFGGKDYDLLASLPIPKREILFVKFFSLFLVEFFYSFIILLPAGIICSIFAGNASYLLQALILLVFTPICPLLIACIIGTFVSIIADRFKIGNILSIIFYFVILGAIMFTSTTASGDASIEPTFDLMVFFNPTIFLLKMDVPVLNYILFVGVNIVLLALVIIMLTCFYDPIHNLLSTANVSKKKFKIKDIKSRKLSRSLFKLDLKRYFSSKAYLMNTIMGGIVALILSVSLPLSLRGIQNEIEVAELLNIILPFMSIGIMWSIGMSVPAASAISIEGKNAWIIKSLPIDYKDYLKNKILLSELILAPFALISSIILIAFGEFSVVTLLTTLLLPQVYLLSVNYLALLLNTKYYKLNWSNEMEVVKNSKCIVFVMLIDFVYSLIVAASLIAGSLINLWAGFGICLVIQLVVLLIARTNLYKKGPMRIAEIEI